MAFEADMVARLTADAGVAAIADARIYPKEAPPLAALPYVIFHRADTDADDTLGQASVHRIMIVIEAHAATYKEALDLAAAIRPALDNWTGVQPAAIMCMTFADEFDGEGEQDEQRRRARTHNRTQAYLALCRA